MGGAHNPQLAHRWNYALGLMGEFYPCAKSAECPLTFTSHRSHSGTQNLPVYNGHSHYGLFTPFPLKIQCHDFFPPLKVRSGIMIIQGERIFPKKCAEMAKITFIHALCMHGCQVGGILSELATPHHVM